MTNIQITVHHTEKRNQEEGFSDKSFSSYFAAIHSYFIWRLDFSLFS